MKTREMHEEGRLFCSCVHEDRGGLLYHTLIRQWNSSQGQISKVKATDAGLSFLMKMTFTEMFPAFIFMSCSRYGPEKSQLWRSPFLIGWLILLELTLDIGVQYLAQRCMSYTRDIQFQILLCCEAVHILCVYVLGRVLNAAHGTQTAVTQTPLQHSNFNTPLPPMATIQ